MYKTLFIDFDDTLYDTRGNAELSLREMFAHFQLSKYFPQPDDFYRSYWDTNVKLWDAYAKGEIDRDYLIVERFRRPLAEGRDAKGRPFEPTREYCLEVSDVFLDMCADKPGVVEGAHELMAYLRAKGYELYMCSNGFHEVQYRKLRACGLLDAFDGVILSEDAGANKPSKTYFDYAIRVSGASASETLMIGDNFSTDIMGAMQYGIDALFFNRHPESFVSHEAVKYEVSSLRDIISIL